MTNTFFRTRATISSKIIALVTVLTFAGSLLMPLTAAHAQVAPEAVVSTIEETTTDTTEVETSVEESTPVEPSDEISETDETPEEGTIEEEILPLIESVSEEVAALAIEDLIDLPEPSFGAIAVCKVVLDENGIVIVGNDESDFSVEITDANQAVVGTASFSTPLTYDVDMLSDVEGNDAQCQTFSNLELLSEGATEFHYAAETISGGTWLPAQYAELGFDSTTTLSSDELKVFGEMDGTLNLPLPSVELPESNVAVLLVVNQMEVEEVIKNSCIEPNTLGDEINDTIQDSNEKTVQEILDANGYSSVDADDDQYQYQVWDVVEGQVVTVDTEFLDREAGHGNVFGYYTNGDLDTFVPVFKKGTSAEYPDVPEAGSGSTYSFVVPSGATTLGFAIKSYDGELTAVIATQNDLNEGDVDNVVAYNPASNVYVLGFEDLDEGSDYDFNDIVVKISIDCTDGGTGGGSAQCVDGKDNDDDGLSDQNDPGCHTDGDADDRHLLFHLNLAFSALKHVPNTSPATSKLATTMMNQMLNDCRPS
jgi:hypothetical protein